MCSESAISNEVLLKWMAGLQAAGVPSIVFGPGVWTVGPDEAVSLDEAANYAATLIELAASVATTGVQQ